MTPHHLLEIVVEATSAYDAEAAARAWAAAEPKIRLVRLTRVRPAVFVTGTPFLNRWTVELEYTAVETDQMQAGL
jgi:hypothetical protein